MREAYIVVDTSVVARCTHARCLNHLYKTIIVMYTDSDMRCMLSGGGSGGGIHATMRA